MTGQGILKSSEDQLTSTQDWQGFGDPSIGSIVAKNVEWRLICLRNGLTISLIREHQT
jgi:hypothetical protein